MKVLLISPTDPRTPLLKNLKYLVGGENTYTQNLLSNPPDNIKYYYYQDELKKGKIKMGKLDFFFKLLTKLRIFPLSAGTIDIVINQPYDLIHCHVYSLRIDKNIPIIMSDSSSNIETLSGYFHWQLWRIKSTYFIRYLVHKMLSVNDLDLKLGRYRYLILFSKYALYSHEKFIGKDSRNIVIPVGINNISRKKINKTHLINILFVGTWFERKGGMLLLDVYTELSNKYKNLTLTIIGDVPSKVHLNNYPRIKHKRWVSRDELYNSYFPFADIFVLIPTESEGYGFSAIEAMSFGIPTVVTQIGALPEIVINNKNGFVIKPNSRIALKRALNKLVMSSKLRNRFSINARKMFINKYSIDKSNIKLYKIYKKAILDSQKSTH